MISSGSRSPRKCRRMSSRFRHSRTNCKSSSAAVLPTDSRNLLHAFLCTGWLSTITPSKSKTTPLIMCLPGLRFRESRPRQLGCSVSFHCSDIDKKIRNSIGRQSSNEERQDMESKIDRTCVRNFIQKCGCGHHQSGECQIPWWNFGLFHKISDDTFFINLHDSASARVRHLVYSYSGNLAAVAMKIQHVIHVSRSEDIRIKNPKGCFFFYPTSVSEKSACAAKQSLFFKQMYL